MQQKTLISVIVICVTGCVNKTVVWGVYSTNFVITDYDLNINMRLLFTLILVGK